MNKGFEYSGKNYISIENELHRMPYSKNNRFYGAKKCAKWIDESGKHLGFFLGKDRKSISQINSMLHEVDYSLPIDFIRETPF